MAAVLSVYVNSEVGGRVLAVTVFLSVAGYGIGCLCGQGRLDRMGMGFLFAAFGGTGYGSLFEKSMDWRGLFASCGFIGVISGIVLGVAGSMARCEDEQQIDAPDDPQTPQSANHREA